MTRLRLARLTTAIVTFGSVGSVLITAHTLVNLRRLRTPQPRSTAVSQRISVLIPARDEAANIGACIDAARGQAGVPHLEIVVFDDRSSDHTAQVVEQHLDDDRVRLVTGVSEPPTGWLGKTWACQKLAEHSTGDVLVFVDADVVLQPHALSAAVSMLTQKEVDALSPYPRQIAVSPVERLVQPLLQWSWLSFLPLDAAESSARESLTAANGQFLLITREAHQLIGGHSAVRGEVLDDVGLFRALKRAGRRGVIADGTTLATCRMYQNWPDLRDGYTKSLWSAFGSRAGAIGTCVLLAVVYVVPAAAMLRRSKVGAVGYLAAVAGRMAVGRRVNSRIFPDAFAHPLSITALAYLTALSWLRRGRGELQWKGRPLVTSQPVDTT